MKYHRVPQWKVNTKVVNVDNALRELTKAVAELHDLDSTDKHEDYGYGTTDQRPRELQLLISITDDILSGGRAYSGRRITDYIDSIPFDELKKESFRKFHSEIEASVDAVGMRSTLKSVVLLLQREQRELEARKEDKTYCDVCRKSVKNLKSHSKSQSHKGRVRIKELKASGFVPINSLDCNGSWNSFIAEIKRPDIPNINRFISGRWIQRQGEEFSTKVYGFSTKEDLDAANKEEERKLKTAYDDVFVVQPYEYNKNGSANRYRGTLWVKDYIANYGEQLYDAVGVGIKQGRTDQLARQGGLTEEVAKERYEKRKSWRASMDKILFDPSKVKIWATMQALKG